MNVVLQCIEEVSKESLVSSATLSSVCSVHGRHSECCHNTLQSQFALPIPLGACQSFKTQTVTVKWQLHFEFLISKKSTAEVLTHPIPSTGFSGSSATLWKGVGPVVMDTMTWDLSVNVLPTTPSQAEPLTHQKQHVIKLWTRLYTWPYVAVLFHLFVILHIYCSSVFLCWHVKWGWLCTATQTAEHTKNVVIILYNNKHYGMSYSMQTLM